MRLIVSGGGESHLSTDTRPTSRVGWTNFGDFGIRQNHCADFDLSELSSLLGTRPPYAFQADQPESKCHRFDDPFRLKFADHRIRLNRRRRLGPVRAIRNTYDFNRPDYFA